MFDHTKSSVATAGISGVWVFPDEIDNAPGEKGAYVLALRLIEIVQIEIPRVDVDQLMPGWYLYVGSAEGSGGIRSRLRRHFRSEKKAHWHVDHRDATMILLAYTKLSAERFKDFWAD